MSCLVQPFWWCFVHSLWINPYLFICPFTALSAVGFTQNSVHFASNSTQFMSMVHIIYLVVCEYTVHIHSSYRSFIQLLVNTQLMSTVHIIYPVACQYTVHIIYPVACQYTVHIHSLYQSFLQLLLIHSSYHLYSCLSIHSSYPQFIQFISVICPVVCQYTVHIHSSYQSFIQLLVSTQFISTVDISHFSSCL